MEYNDREIKVYDGKVMPERAMQQTQNMMQMKTQYIAAMMVPIPRDEERILDKIKKIAEKRGHAFFYLWPIKDKNSPGGVRIITGGTIDLAETIVYYWTNIAIEHDIQDLGDKWKIRHVFIDFERGLQIPRTAIIHKPKEAPGGWDKDRWERMSLNRADSYNYRDLVFRYTPRWMKDEIVERAKVAEIKKAQIEFDKGEAVNLFAAFKMDYGIEENDIYGFIGIEKNEFNSKHFFMMKNIYGQLYRGDAKGKDILKFIEKKENKSPKLPTKKADSSKMERPMPEQPKPKEEKLKNKIETEGGEITPASSGDPDKVDISAAKFTERPIYKEMQNMFKSLILRGISEMEICAYFYVEDLDEVDESYYEGISHVVTEIESEKMTIDEFKIEAAERLTAKIEMDKKK